MESKRHGVHVIPQIPMSGFQITYANLSMRGSGYSYWRTLCPGRVPSVSGAVPAEGNAVGQGPSRPLLVDEFVKYPSFGLVVGNLLSSALSTGGDFAGRSIFLLAIYENVV